MTTLCGRYLFSLSPTAKQKAAAFNSGSFAFGLLLFFRRINTIMQTTMNSTDQEVKLKGNYNKQVERRFGLLHEAVEVDVSSKTGLRWKTRPRHHFMTNNAWAVWNAKYPGTTAGTIVVAGCKKYWALRISRVSYLAHRVIYFLAHGIYPGSLQIDHRDGNGLNNNLDNLRLATSQENNRNKTKQKNNTSGHTGVWWSKRTLKWRVRLCADGRRLNLGSFSDAEEAAIVYQAAAREHFGEFYRPS